MSDPALFQARSVSFGYGGQSVLTGLDLELQAGRFYGLVGPNGCGKTTLLDLLLGLKRPWSGQVLLNGRPVGSLARRELARVAALVPQETGIDFPFSVTEVVLMGRYPHLGRFTPPTDGDWALVRSALDRTDLRGLADKKVTELSTGERQRVLLARALAQDAPTLLLDEPTASLDIKHALLVMTLLGELVGQGRTVVAVMHDLNLAATHCQDLIWIKAGTVRAQGPVTEVLTPENIRQVFEVEASVRSDELTGRPRASYRISKDLT